MQLNNADRPMRICKSRTEINSIFQKIMMDKTVISMWQPQDDCRKKSEAFIFNIDNKNRTIAIKPHGSVSFKFSKPFKTYIYGDDYSLLFKVVTTLVLENMIIIRIPNEIRILEKRRCPRISFGNSNKKEVLIKKYLGHEETVTELTLRLIDISKSGMAIIAYSHDLALFAKDSQLSLSKLGEIEITPEVKGVVAYTRQMKRKSETVSKVFRIGVRFLKEISQDQINKITNKN